MKTYILSWFRTDRVPNFVYPRWWQFWRRAEVRFDYMRVRHCVTHIRQDEADVVLKNYVGERIALAYEAIESRIDGIQRIIDCIDTRLGGVVIPTTGRVQIDARILGLILTEREAMQQRMRMALAHLVNLQPHIAQLPKRDQPSIDSHVDMAIEALK